MRGIDGIGNWVLVIMAAASLISMIAAFGLNNIVSHDLTSYGLSFSYGWAIPYWNTIGTVIAMAWVNIIAAIVFQIYRIRTVRKEEMQSDEEQSTSMLSWADEQEEADSEDGNRKVYGISIVTNQPAIQEAEEQPQIVPYEPETCEQSEAQASEHT